MNLKVDQLLREAAGFAQSGRKAEAILAYQRALALEPGLPDSWYNLGLLLRADGQADAALAAYQQAIDRGLFQPEEAMLNRAVIFADDLRREDKAEEELHSALKINPDYVPAILNLANLKEEFGERDAAAALYKRILPSDEERPLAFQDLRLEALSRLAHLEPASSADDPAILRLERAASQPAAINAETRANLYFALGRTLDRVGEFDRAFKAFVQANAHVRRAGPNYDRESIVRDVDAHIREFPEAPRIHAPRSAPEPVFICGMFRSGSTLVEQVLASHPMVTPGGELNLLNRLAAELAPYPQSIRTLSEERAAKLGEFYRRELVRLFPESAAEGSIVTDKRPDNFLRIGLLKRLFPGAKIVHTTRHPVDTCLSVFFQHIDQRLVGYASDLTDCGHYFAEYRRMMTHWKSVYAADIFDFDYDRFVENPKPELERLLAFLGLDWDERCLSFHALRNPVKTASYWQVRQPLYKDSSGRRKNYAAHLTPLAAALKSGGIDVD